MACLRDLPRTLKISLMDLPMQIEGRALNLANLELRHADR